MVARARRRSFAAQQLRFAWSRWLDDIRAKIPETIMTAAASLCLGVYLGAYTEAIIQEGWVGGLVGGAIGAAGGPVLFWLGLFLWRFFTAPAQMWQLQQDEIERLKAEALTVHGGSGPRTPDYLKFMSVAYSPDRGKTYHFALTKTAPVNDFRVFYNGDLDGNISVTLFPKGSAVEVEIYRRQETSFMFGIESQYNVDQPVLFVAISAQSSAPVKLIEISSVGMLPD